MKKINKYVTGLVFVLIIFAFSKANAINIPSLNFGSISANPGTQISVPINASNWNNGVSAMDLLVKYDPTVLRIDSITENPNLADPLFNKNYSSNMIYLSYLADVDTNFNLDNGVIATLNFTVLSNSATTTSLSFKTTAPGLRSKLYDVYGTPIPANFLSGAVSVVLPAPQIPKIIKAVSKTNKTIKDSTVKGLPAILPIAE